jgi:hypothetical protein
MGEWVGFCAHDFIVGRYAVYYIPEQDGWLATTRIYENIGGPPLLELRGINHHMTEERIEKLLLLK